MYFVKMFRLSPHWGSIKTIKTNTCFSKIAKRIFVFIVSLNFYQSQKYFMQILPIDRCCFIKHYSAISSANTRCTYPKKLGFVSIFLWSPSENDNCKVRKYKL